LWKNLQNYAIGTGFMLSLFRGSFKFLFFYKRKLNVYKKNSNRSVHTIFFILNTFEPTKMAFGYILAKNV